MTPPKPVDLERIKYFLDRNRAEDEDNEAIIYYNWFIEYPNVPGIVAELERLRARVKELEDRPIEIDTSNDKIIRILTKKLEELTAENERLRDGNKNNKD